MLKYLWIIKSTWSMSHTHTDTEGLPGDQQQAMLTDI